MECERCKNGLCEKLKEFYNIDKPCLFIGGENTCIYFRPKKVSHNLLQHITPEEGDVRMIEIDQIDINALRFGIMCNFPPHCGEERAKEALETLSKLEKAYEEYIRKWRAYNTQTGGGKNE